MTSFDLLGLLAIGLVAWALSRLREQEARMGDLRRELDDLRAHATAAPARPAAPVAPAPAPAPVQDPSADADTIALLTLAASAWLRAPARIVAINYPVPANLTWAAEGREDIMHSHRLR